MNLLLILFLTIVAPTTPDVSITLDKHTCLVTDCIVNVTIHVARNKDNRKITLFWAADDMPNSSSISLNGYNAPTSFQFKRTLHETGLYAFIAELERVDTSTVRAADRISVVGGFLEDPHEIEDTRDR